MPRGRAIRMQVRMRFQAQSRPSRKLIDSAIYLFITTRVSDAIFVDSVVWKCVAFSMALAACALSAADMRLVEATKVSCPRRGGHRYKLSVASCGVTV